MPPLDQLGRAFQEGSRGTTSCLASLLLQCDVKILTMLLTIAAVTAITYYCYSCSSLSKSGRARKEEDEEEDEEGTPVERNGGGGGGVHSLPSPAPLLPTWLGFLGGHTLQISRAEVRD